MVSIDQMDLAELKREMMVRGLRHKGTRDDLIARLKSAVEFEKSDTASVDSDKDILDLGLDGIDVSMFDQSDTELEAQPVRGGSSVFRETKESGDVTKRATGARVTETSQYDLEFVEEVAETSAPLRAASVPLIAMSDPLRATAAPLRATSAPASKKFNKPAIDKRAVDVTLRLRKLKIVGPQIEADKEAERYQRSDIKRSGRHSHWKSSNTDSEKNKMTHRRLFSVVDAEIPSASKATPQVKETQAKRLKYQPRSISQSQYVPEYGNKEQRNKRYWHKGYANSRTKNEKSCNPFKWVAKPNERS